VPCARAELRDVCRYGKNAYGKNTNTIEPVDLLIRAAKSDTIYRDIYLRRARELLSPERSSVRGRILIPGWGSGYKIQAFHAAGYDVSAIDFSRDAVEQAKRVLGVVAKRVVLGDFFAHDFGPNRSNIRLELLFNSVSKLLGRSICFGESNNET